MRSALYDGREVTEKARSTFLSSFLDAVDPDRVLPEGERTRRAEAARRAHFVRLGLKSAKSRAKKARRKAGAV
jgi:hypothetical protein